MLKIEITKNNIRSKNKKQMKPQSRQLVECGGLLGSAGGGGVAAASSSMTSSESMSLTQPQVLAPDRKSVV